MPSLKLRNKFVRKNQLLEDDLFPLGLFSACFQGQTPSRCDVKNSINFQALKTSCVQLTKGEW